MYMISFKRKRNDSGEDVQATKQEKQPAHQTGTSTLSGPSLQLSSKYGIGAKLLLGMGYVPGRGLGSDGAGIVNPIETETRAKGVGIGMFRGMHPRSAGYDDDMYASSSDEEDLSTEQRALSSKYQQPVTFSANVQILKSSQEDELHLIKQRLQKLNYKYSEDELSIENLPKLKVLILRLSQKQAALAKAQQRHETLVNEQRTKQESLDAIDRLLEFLSSEQTTSKTNIDHENIMHVIDETLNCSFFSNFEKDKYLSLLLDMHAQTINVDLEYLLQENNALLAMLNQVISLVAYHPEFQNSLAYDVQDHSDLSFLQSSIYFLLSPSFEQFFQNLIIPSDLSTCVTLLLDYEDVLKFINYFDYLVAQHLSRKLIQSLKTHDLLENHQLLTFFKDFELILPDMMKVLLKDIVKEQFQEFLQTWYHSDVSEFPNDLLEIIKSDVYGDPCVDFYRDITKSEFVQRFFEQMWPKYFDLQQDLVEGQEKFVLYFVKTLFQWKTLIEEESFNIILYHCFNEIKKVIFQWYFFKRDTFHTEAMGWYEWIKSVFPAKNLYCKQQLFDIDQWLKNGPSGCIHDETRNLYDDLFSKAETYNQNYTVENIPLGKIECSFAEVVDKFCQEHDLLMAKRTAVCEPVLLEGVDAKEVHPLYVIQSLDSLGTNEIFEVLCLIKNDTLWIQSQDSANCDYFKPIILQDLLAYFT